MAELPPGFFEAPPQQAEAPSASNELPPVTVAPPPPPKDTPVPVTNPSPSDEGLPVGFSASPPPPPPPEGFSYDDPVNPQTGDPTEKTNVETPGFWTSVGSAFGRGFTQNVADAAAGAKVLLPPGQGGQTLEEQYQAGLLHPDTKDEIDNLTKMGIFSGYSDPKWWGVNIAHSVGGTLPALGAGTVGAIAGPVGAIGGFAGESALSKLVPAYKEARTAGLDPDAAMHRALIDSGIAGVGAVAMGLAPELAIFGKTGVGEAATEAAANAFKRPALEAVAQLGVVQPVIGDAQNTVTALTHGESPSAEDHLTNLVLGGAAGVVPVGAHAAVRGMAPRAGSDSIPASPATVSEAFHSQDPQTAAAQENLLETTLHPEPRENRVFFSKAKEVIDQKISNNASPEQIIASLKNNGVKDEEILDLGLPGYLADQNGKVNKADLLAHVESNAVVLEEAQTSESGVMQAAKALASAAGNWDDLDPRDQQYYVTQAEREISAPYISLVNNLGRRYGNAIPHWPEEARNELAAAKAKVDEAYTARDPEYSTQILPGQSSNYRELLLKTPVRGKLIEPEVDYDPNVPRGWQAAGDVGPRPDENLNYIGSHFNDPNIIAHIRTTDRFDRDGRKLLHVEEIQSDLHQAGRKQGYKDPNVPSLEEAGRAYRAQNRIFDDFMRQHGKQEGETPEAARARLDAMPEYHAMMAARRPVSEAFQAANANQTKLPDLPFKTSWPELAVKRVLRLAADEGYDGVSWTNGDQVGLRQATSEQLRGSREFYDKIITSLFKKWAKKLGGTLGETKIMEDELPAPYPMRRVAYEQMGLDLRNFNDRNNFIEANPAFGDRVRMGLPLYDEGLKPSGGRTLTTGVDRGMAKQLKAPAKKSVEFVQKFAQEMKISRNIIFDIGPKSMLARGFLDKKLGPNGEYVVHINTNRIPSAVDLYATVAHEFGHVIFVDKFKSAPDTLKTAIYEAHRVWRAGQDRNSTVGEVRATRDNPISEVTGARNETLASGEKLNDIALSDLTPKSREYFLSFNEWAAEQVAKWMTTDEKPLSRLEQFWSSMGKKIRAVLAKFNLLRPVPAGPHELVSGWLNSFLQDVPPDYAKDIRDRLQLDTTLKNAEALDRDGTPFVQATPETAATGGGRNIIDNLPPDSKSAGAATAAHADRMNKFYEWMTSLPQIAELNKHIRGLQMYKEVVALMNLEKNNWMGAAQETLRRWSLIKDPQQVEGLRNFINDYARGLFKDPSDTSGTIRRPTQKEFADLVAKHKLSDASVRIFQRVTKDFDNFLEKYRELLLADAAKIKDPQAQQDRVDAVNRQVNRLLERPFFPLSRFGKYTVTVYDSQRNIRHTERVNSLRDQKRLLETLKKSPDLLPGDVVVPGMVAKDATPLMGMPPGMLDLMADKLSLSPTQRDALDQLRADYAPSNSFRHQFKARDLTPGWSTDFQRSYAHFFFHGANHYTRIKYADKLRDHMREVRESTFESLTPTKRDYIANYMTEHFRMLMDPKPDFAALRGLMFHWYLGFNPASATLNLSQTAMMTYPHLASKFSDVKSLAAITRAGTDLNNFYKKGNLVTRGDAIKGKQIGYDEFKTRALGEAVKEGIVSETQAHVLAAISEDRNLLRAFGTKAEAAWLKFSEASSWMFEMTEQYNRRVAFRAALDLAYREPNNKYVSETVRDNPLQYSRLRDQGWTHQEASAFTAAKHTAEATQFVYAPYARPKFMWGRKGALFIFKSFTQNTLFNLYNNPAGAARTLLILGAVGGLMGLPGMEDINGILKALAYRLFGKDFDLEDEGRKFAVDVLHGAIGPDLLLHGTSVKGFGIPQVMNLLGAQVGLPKIFPTLDRHNSIGMGNVLPFEPGKLFGPSKDPKSGELQQVQRASGAGFSLGFALYNFLMSDKSMSDLKRWEPIMPRAMSNLSHAYRFLHEGQERNSTGNSIVKFNPDDTEQAAEIFARAMGYQPRRLTAQYEAIQGKTEAATYWDLRKAVLLQQFGTAVKAKSAEDKARVIQSIRNFNQELPPEWKPKAITSQVLKESVMARMKSAAKQEAGLPTSKQNIAGWKALDKYYPEGRPTGLVGAKPVQ